MSVSSFFKRLRSRTSDTSTDSARRASREDEMYHYESNPVYLQLLTYTSKRRITIGSIPRRTWSDDDERIWLFKTLVEVCDRPEYNAYDIATRWEYRLYEVEKEDWQRLLGSEKDGATIYGILRGMERRAGKVASGGDDMSSISMPHTKTWASRLRFKWWSRTTPSFF
ncbi:hypothetical protein DSL72_003026 [Monilinia vaccinii-corymbosi]|uniref:Uncharacterized protein n=1 Tax=Monilinia vaccinii-corymbosi TaxID=61207 RepID=A0A8A3P539_9HELO|nr:hypothetical protein DSL72_003026 [Monilinia vaccinii-corymbosi]